MKCPHCQHTIELAWRTLRKGRVAAGLCPECGVETNGHYRCETCRRKANIRRAEKRSAKHRVSAA